MELSGQCLVLVVLYPPGKEPPEPTGWEAEWATEPIWTQRLEENFAPVRDLTLVDQSIVSITIITKWDINYENKQESYMNIWDLQPQLCIQVLLQQ
jgi:hypothetical protein